MLDLLNSAFLSAYFERLADGKCKSAKKIWREAVTAYFEFPSQNLFIRTWESYPTLRMPACSPTGIFEYEVRVMNPVSRH
jgi:hypothetical protein